MNCNQNTFYWFHVITSVSCLKIRATVHYDALNCLMWLWLNNHALHTSGCVECACKVSQSGLLNHRQPPAECFLDIWLRFGFYRPLWQVTSPRCEVLLFSDISAGWRDCVQGWLILAGSIHFNKFISSPVCTWSKWKSHNNHLSTAGPDGGKNWGADCSHISLNVKMVLMWFCLLPEEMLWSCTVVSTYQCWWSIVVELQ